MWLNILIFLVGLVFLVKGSDFFVKSASMIAKKLGISEFVIGLTLVALGTSVPELASSIVASVKSASGIIIGNVVGSNIANIGLIVGVAATLAVIKTNKEMLTRDGYLMIIASFLLLVFALNMEIGAVESTVFLIMYLMYISFLFIHKPLKKELKGVMDHPLNLHYLKNLRNKFYFYLQDRGNSRRIMKKIDRYFLKHIGIFLVSGAAIVFGAKLLVEQAVYMAGILGVSDMLIGITMIAVGTSLPELMVTISAAKQGRANMAVGNVIGSNIANIFLVLGVSGLISPIAIEKSSLLISIPFMIILSLVLLLFVRTNWKIRKWEGVTLLALYGLFIVGSFFLF